MGTTVEVECILHDAKECVHCGTRAKKPPRVQGVQGAVYCVDCLFGVFNVQYDSFFDYILRARRLSIRLAKQNNAPQELLGQCFRNAVALLRTLEKEAPIPSDALYLAVGDVRLNNSSVTHYWVVLRHSEYTLHLDVEVFCEEGGVWIDNNPPNTYTLRETIPVSQSHRFPQKVRKWY